MYAELCVRLSKAIPEFPSDEDDGKAVAFRRILLNSCQKEFEGADNMRAEIHQLTKPEQELECFEKERILKLRTLGNIRLIGELFKLKMIPEKIVHHCPQMLLGSDLRIPSGEENLEALCQLFATVGKHLDESAKSTKATDSYFSQLKDFSTNSCLAPNIRFMIRNTIDMRANKWLPRREEDSAPAIIRAANPWIARRGPVSDKEKVLRTVERILRKLTPEKFEVLLDQLLNSGIDSAEILKGVVSLVFDKAVLEPTKYAELCVRLSKALPEFPSDEDDGKAVAFRRILLNSCQEEFEGADNMRAEIHQLTKPEQGLERFKKERILKLRKLGNIRLIGELFKLKMIPEKIVHYCIKVLLGSDLEALCQLFATVGKQLDESAKSTKATDSYFSQLKDFSTNSRLAPKIRFMIRNTIDMRANKWLPRQEVAPYIWFMIRNTIDMRANKWLPRQEEDSAAALYGLQTLGQQGGEQFQIRRRF